MNHALHGSQSPTTGLVPLSMGLQDQPYFDDANKHLAIEYLEKGLHHLGVEKKNFPLVKLSYPASDKMQRIAQVLQQQWLENLDILVQLESLEPKVYFSNLSQKNFDFAIGSWFADFNDPINFLEIFSSKENGSNRTQWEDNFYSGQIKNSYFINDSKERLSCLKNIEKCLIEAMPIIPLSNHDFIYVKNQKLENIELNGFGEIDFRSAFVKE